MQKISKILLETEGILGNEGSSTTAADLTRIANALERIATSLEKLTSVGTNPTVAVQQTKPEPVKVVANTVPSPKKKINQGSSQAKPKQISVLDEFLNKKGVTIIVPKKKAFTAEEEKVFDKIALHLGKNFTYCKDIYLELKANSKSELINYSLQGANPQKNTEVRQFCANLETAGLIDKYSYENRPKYLVQFKPSNIEKRNKNFVEGKWLERYLNQEVQRILPLLDLKFKTEVRPNLSIQINNSLVTQITALKTELDILFSVEKHIFCIEAKTNAKKNILKTQLNKIGLLGLAPSNLMIVAAENSEDDLERISQALNGVKVVGLDTFEATLTTMVKAACGPK